MNDSGGIEALRAELIQLTTDTRDVELLRNALKVLRGRVSEEQVGYRPGGRSISRSEYEAVIALSQQQVERGEYVTMEELEEESKTWL